MPSQIQYGGHRTREVYFQLINGEPYVHNKRLNKKMKLEVTKNGKLKYAGTKKYVNIDVDLLEKSLYIIINQNKMN